MNPLVNAVSAVYRTLEITTTAGCKVRCGYCPQDRFARAQRAIGSPRYLQLEDFEKCLDTVPPEVDVCFSGYAEPWLNPSCTSMVEHVVRRGHDVKIFSTLVGMADQDLERIACLPLKRFLVHLPDDGTLMSVSVDESYINLLKQVISKPISGLKFMAVGPIHPKIMEMIPAEQIANCQVISRAGNVTESIIIAPLRLNGALKCAAQRLYRNVLLPNGDVTLCCMDYGRKHVLGNLLITSYLDLHRGEAFKGIIRRMGGDDGPLLCRDCEFAVSQ